MESSWPSILIFHCSYLTRSLLLLDGCLQGTLWMIPEGSCNMAVRNVDESWCDVKTSTFSRHLINYEGVLKLPKFTKHGVRNLGVDEIQVTWAMASLSMNMRPSVPLNTRRAARAVVPGHLRKILIDKEGEERREGRERARTPLRLSSSMTLSKLIYHPESKFLRFIGRDWAILFLKFYLFQH